jgi:hypothetical protein
MGLPEGPNESLPAWHSNRSYLHRRSVPLPSRSATGSAHRTTHPATPRPRPGRLHIQSINHPSSFLLELLGYVANRAAWACSKTSPISPQTRLTCPIACTRTPVATVLQSHLARHVHNLGGAECRGGARIRREPNRHSTGLIAPLDSSERFGSRRRRPTLPAERRGGRT